MANDHDPPREFTSDAMRATFESYPERLRQRLLDLRTLILDTAVETEGVGEIEETLKWGEPSYLTSKPKSGTTIRIAPVRGDAGRYGLFVSCQTTLVDTYRQMYPDLFSFDGSRGLLFDVNESVPADELAHCVAMALCYHADKRQASGARG